MEKRVQSSFKPSHSMILVKKTLHDHQIQRQTPKHELITNYNLFFVGWGSGAIEALLFFQFQNY